MVVSLFQQTVANVIEQLTEVKGISTEDTLWLHAGQELLSSIVECVEENAENVALHAPISSKQFNVVDELPFRRFVVLFRQVFCIELFQTLLEGIRSHIEDLASDTSHRLRTFFQGELSQGCELWCDVDVQLSDESPLLVSLASFSSFFRFFLLPLLLLVRLHPVWYKQEVGVVVSR